jgi:hypothetical protein
MKTNKTNYSRFNLFGLLIILLVIVFYVIVQQRRDDDTFENAILSEYAEYVARVLTDGVKNQSPGVGQLLLLKDVTVEVASADLKDLVLSPNLPIVKSDRVEEVRRYLEKHPEKRIFQDDLGISHYIGISDSESGLLVSVTPKTNLFRTSRLLVPVLLPFLVVVVYWSVMAILTQQKNLIASNRTNLNLSAELQKATQNAEDCLHGPVQSSYDLISRKIEELDAESLHPQEVKDYIAESLHLLKKEVKDYIAESLHLLKKEVKDYINEVSYPLRGYMRYFRELGKDVPVISMFTYYLHCIDLLVDSRCAITYFLPTEEEAERVLGGNTEAKIALQMNLYDAVQNAITYSEAQKIAVRMEISDSATTLVVIDDGKGFESENELRNLNSQDGRGHYGLEHFLRRARYFDEDVEDNQVIRSKPGEGCTISLRIPQKTKVKPKISFRRAFALLQDYIQNFCTAHISVQRKCK